MLFLAREDERDEQPRVSRAGPEEWEIARWIGALVERHLSAVAGEPTEQNVCKDPTLTMDFTFDQASDRFALEVTRLTAHFEGASDAVVKKFTKRVTREATKLGSPHWRIGFQPESKLDAELLSWLTTLMKVMLALNLERLHPGSYSHDIPLELLARLDTSFHHACERARGFGLLSLQRADAGAVLVLPVVEWSDSNTVFRPLQRAMLDQEAKLGECKRRGYWTMLAVDVQRPDTRQALGDGVKVRNFGRGVDHLCLLVRDDETRGLADAYYANRGQPRLTRVEAVGYSHARTGVTE